MSKSDLQHLFCAFRDHGDAAALARVFDATAPDLLALARHLAANKSDAEDLLQSTWLTVIEKAGSFDSERPIRPWLVGILVRHARSARRRVNPYLRTESYEPERLLEPDPRDPRELAAERELAQEVSQALDRLPSKYREVVTPRVASGERGTDIAERVGRRPEIVRVQISRGLELLRRLLPASLATGGLLSVSARQSLAAVRGNILARAADPSGSPIATTVLSGATGGLFVSGKLILFGATALVALTASFLLLSPDPEEAPESFIAAKSLGPLPPDPGPADVGPLRRDVPGAADLVSSASEPELVPGATWLAEEGEATGRILVDGSPLVDVSVSLLRPRKSLFDGSLSVQNVVFRDEAPVAEVGRARTDGAGRFSLRGLRVGDLHLLGIDLGGGYGSLRAIRQTPDQKEGMVIGDIELGPAVSVSGVVADEDGDPVVGAMVRAINAPLPVPLQATGLAQLTSEGAVGRLDSGEMRPLPVWLGEWWSRLPFPTAKTDTEGRFHLAAVPRGMVTVVATKAGEVPAMRVTPTGGGAERDIGVLTMESSRFFVGKVLRKGMDGDEAVPNAEVRVGVPQPLIGLSLMSAITETDNSGVFGIRGLPEFVELVAAVRANPKDAWTIHEIGDVEEVDLYLPAQADISVHVEMGEGVLPNDVQVFAVPFGNVNSVAAGIDSGPRHMSEGGEAPGQYVIRDLAVGEYWVITETFGVRTPWRVSLPSEGVKVRAVAQAPVRLSVKVVDDQDRPIGDARVRMVPDVIDFGEKDQAWTDASGVATLDLRAAINDTAALGRLSLMSDLEVQAKHPSFGIGSLPIEASQLREGQRDFVVRVRPTSRIEGRITLSNAPPPEPLMFVAYEFDGFLGFLDGQPSPAMTDARGDFVVPGLPPGQYMYKVFPSFLKGDLIAQSLSFANPPEALASGSVRVSAGETQRLEIRAYPEDSPVASRLSGRILLDGLPPADARVSVYPLEAQGGGGAAGGRARGADVDSSGLYEIAGIPPGPASIQVKLTDRSPEHFRSWTAFEDKFDLRVATAERLDLDLQTFEVSVRVSRPDGEKHRGIQVELRGADPGNIGFSGNISTDESGVATVQVYRPGRYHVEAYSSLYGVAKGVCATNGPNDVELTLEPGVPCAGTFTVPGDWEAEMGRGFPHLSFTYLDDGKLRTRTSLIWPKGSKEFEVSGLSAGRIEVRVEFGTFSSDPVEVLLSDGGSRSLRLKFR